MKYGDKKMTFLSILDNEIAHLKAEKDEEEGQEDDCHVYIRKWTHPPEGRGG